MRVKTDGEVARITNRIVTAMVHLQRLPTLKLSQRERTGREARLQGKIDELVALLETGEHPQIGKIVASVKVDIAQGRARYVSVGARRYFDFPLNWKSDGGIIASAPPIKGKTLQFFQSLQRPQQALS